MKHYCSGNICLETPRPPTGAEQDRYVPQQHAAATGNLQHSSICETVNAHFKRLFQSDVALSLRVQSPRRRVTVLLLYSTSKQFPG
jgi:hypothetical protein